MFFDQFSEGAEGVGGRIRLEKDRKLDAYGGGRVLTSPGIWLSRTARL